MTIESRIAALKTALAEKFAREEAWLDDTYSAHQESFKAGIKALEEVVKLKTRIETLIEARSQLEGYEYYGGWNFIDETQKAEAQLEALLASLEEK